METDATQVRIDAERHDDRIPNPSDLLSVDNRPWLWKRTYTTIEVQLLQSTPKNEPRCVDAVPSTGELFSVVPRKFSFQDGESLREHYFATSRLHGFTVLGFLFF